MQKYQVLQNLGSGSFWNVEKAVNTQTGEVVAIKRLKDKLATWEEYLQMAEVKVLRKLSHPNVIKLKEVVREGNEAYLVFEFIEKDLYRLMTERKERGEKLQDQEISYITRQLAEALAYMHGQGFFHRSMKHENILVATTSPSRSSVLASPAKSGADSPAPSTSAPDGTARPKCSSVDVFAVGCIVAEMYLGYPLFPGNSEMNQIAKIAYVLGSPSTSWPDGLKQANTRGIAIPGYPELSLAQDALDFISDCLRWDPNKRITSAQMLIYPFLNRDKLKPELKLELKTMEISWEEQPTPKLEKQQSDREEVRPHQDKKDEPDMLLNDFKNDQIGSKKEKQEDQVCL